MEQRDVVLHTKFIFMRRGTICIACPRTPRKLRIRTSHLQDANEMRPSLAAVVLSLTAAGAWHASGELSQPGDCAFLGYVSDHDLPPSPWRFW